MFDLFENSQNLCVSKVFWLFVYFIQYIVILNIGFGFCVVVCIWEHILEICFDIYFKKKSNNKKNRSVNNFRTNYLFEFVFGFWGPA